MSLATDMPTLATIDGQPTVQVTSLKAWHRWLKANHARSGSVWLVSWQVSVPDRHVPMSDLVDEALCWGWVDSVPKALDNERSMRRMSPRRTGDGCPQPARQPCPSAESCRGLRLIVCGRRPSASAAGERHVQREGGPPADALAARRQAAAMALHDVHRDGQAQAQTFGAAAITG